MALPPQHITVKRRRDDEPVDTLYIQQKRQRPSYLWRRIDSRQTSTTGIPLFAQPPSNFTSLSPRHDIARAGVPVVRPTSPSKDETDEGYSSPRPLPYHQQDVCNAIFKSQVQNMAPEPSPPSSDVLSGLKRRRSSKHLFRPRTFHLSSSLASSSTLIATLRGTPNLKSYGENVAVFMERTKKVPQAQATLRKTTIPNNKLAQIGDDAQKGDDQKSRSREIPITGAIDKEAGMDSSIELANHVASTSTRAQDFKESSGGGDLDAKIAEQLHQIASHLSLQPRPSLGDTPYELQLKNKPKPPNPRPQEKQIKPTGFSRDDVADCMIRQENEDDFIYDTYVRSLGQPTGIPTNISEPDCTESHYVDGSKFGILIIPEQDQAVWETFGEAEESDADWNSEEEDENAEGFYGNDYPEDEVNSDDEFGMGAYDYRHRASDDEEFDEIAGWSDEEGEAQYPWKRSGWRFRWHDSAAQVDRDD